MGAKLGSKPAEAIKNRPKRIPSVKRLESVRPLKMKAFSMVNCGSERCGTV